MNVTEIRQQLRHAGYAPIPCQGKAPAPKEWEKKTDTNDDEIALWQKSFPHAENTGILTRLTPTIDIDILNPEAADAIEALARERFEERGFVLCRFGQAPKRAIPLRTNAPFKKITGNVIAPDGSTQKIELLGDGQQVVAFGTHPTTKKPYSWHGGSPGEIRWDALPYVSEDEARTLVADAVRILTDGHGYKAADARPRERANGNGQDNAGGGHADWAWLITNIHDGRELHDSICTLAAKLLASGMDDAAAGNLIRGAMESSNIARDARWKERCAEIPRAVSSARTKYGKPEAAAPRKVLSATPFTWCDPATIPPRAWLYGRHHIRQFLTCTVALGGVGKSSLAIVEALGLVTGRPLLGITPRQRCRVWLWNGEDPASEMQRRVTAAMVHYAITPADVNGFLFLDNGRDMPIKLMAQAGGTLVATPMIKEEILATLKAKQIDALILDPFIKSHSVNENDNTAIDAVATEWAQIADIANCAIDVNHHPRKTGGNEVTAEDTRGGSSLVSATRSARVGNTMTTEESRDAGIDERQRWRHFRVDNGKANMSAPQERAEWYRLESVPLGNGDEVGVVTPWTWPNPFDDVTAADLKAAQKEVAQGGPWRANPQATRWVGEPIARALEMDIGKPSDRSKIRAVLKTWIATGMFVVVVREDEHRHEKQFVEVGKWADD